LEHITGPAIVIPAIRLAADRIITKR
jgi:hypothetical protein